MDNIWRKAAKNIRKHEERLTAIAATTTTHTYTNPATFALTEENMNTVEKIDTQLARMEQNWAETRSGPFPEGVRNAIAKLRASLEEQDTETIPPLQPADPAVAVRHVATTTITISNTAIEQRDSRELAMGRGEERVRRIKEDEAREPEADQLEELERDREGIESQDEVRGNPPPPTAHPAPVVTVHEPRRFDWVTETDKSIGPVPNARDFRPTAPVPANPNRTPNRCIPATSAPTNNTPTTYMPTAPALVNPDPSDVACVPYPAGIVPFPISPKPIAPDNLVPSVLKEPAPTMLVTPVSPTVYSPCDLSALRSGTSNPWGTLRRRHYHRYSHTPRQFGSAKRGQFAHLYPTNTPIHKHPISESTPSSPFRVFETVKHPHGIGPNKPVIRVPVSITANAPTHHVHEHAIVKVTPPLPHQTDTLRCECGRLIPGTEARDLPIHHTLTTFISSIISHPFFLLSHFFLRFRFS